MKASEAFLFARPERQHHRAQTLRPLLFVTSLAATVPSCRFPVNSAIGITLRTVVLTSTLVRYLWASPATVLGLLVSLPLFAFGAKGACRSGVLEVTLEFPRANHATHLLPFVAVTLGHVVIAASAAHQERLRAHERIHVAQYEKWGPVFLVAYPAESLIQFLRGRRPYFDNRFEVQARELSEAKTEPPGQRWTL
jgi:hypothetical protein